MTISSLLFRRQPAPEPQPLNRLVKPWPLTPAADAAPEDEGADELLSIEPRSAAVRERLAQFIGRR